MDHNHNSQTGPHWYTIYPKEHYVHPAKTRSLLLVNKQIATGAWSQVDFGSPDIMAIQLHTEQEKFLIVNMYNDNNHQDNMRQEVEVMRDRA